jgi:hypothetical protein
MVGSFTAGAGVLMVWGADSVAGVSFTPDAHTASYALAGKPSSSLLPPSLLPTPYSLPFVLRAFPFTTLFPGSLPSCRQ